MKERYNDTDLREALRRKYSETPQLPADFMSSMEQKMQPKPVAKTRILWRWIAAAACLLLIIGIGTTQFPREEKPEPPSQLVHKTAPQNDTAATTPDYTTETHGLHGGNHVFARSKPRVCTEQTDVIMDECPETVQDVCTEEQGNTAPVSVNDPNLHYAAHVTTEDTVAYQAPSRVDEFIAKLAEYNEVKAVPLSCSDGSGDSTIVSTAYLFQDKKELDLFARLLQVACWYDSKAPGYLLNFSRKQFVFCLEDHRIGQKYLWVAERLSGDHILLFCTHSPIETTVSSACFQNFREQLTHKGMITLQF